MIEQFTFQTILQFLQTLSIMAGIGYYIYNLRVQNKSRHAQIYLGLWQRLSSTKMMHALSCDYKVRPQISNYDEWWKMYKENQEYEDSWDFIATTFEAIGVFVHEDLLDLRVFLREAGGYFPSWWRKYGDIIKEHRIKSYPRYYIECEWLYDKVMEFAIKNPDFLI